MKNTVMIAALIKGFVFFATPIIADESHDHEVTDVDHGHEDEVSFDLDHYLYVLKGQDEFGESCYLGVTEEGTSESDGYYAVVETSFNHNGEGPGVLTVNFGSTKDQDRLSGSTDQGGRIAIQLSPSGSDLKAALRYAVSWSHFDHSDYGFCSDLKLL